MESLLFFIEFFTCNPKLDGGEPRFGQRGDIPSYVMVKCGIWGEDACQLHRFFGWNKVKVGRKVPFYVSADDCYVDETCIKGSVNVIGAKEHPEWMCDNGSMKWDLKIDKKVAFNVGYGTCGLFRFLKAFEMYWHAEGMKT